MGQGTTEEHVGAGYRGPSSAQVPRVWIPVSKGDKGRVRGRSGWKDALPGLSGGFPCLWEGTCVYRSSPVLGTATIESCPEMPAAQLPLALSQLTLCCHGCMSSSEHVSETNQTDCLLKE